MLPDGVGIRIPQHVMYEPDALVYCGPELPGDVMEVPDPIVVVEVASPSTRKMDAWTKLDDYFRLPSLHHLSARRPGSGPVIHRHRRQDGQNPLCAVHEGMLTLAPPGLEMPAADLLAIG